MGTATRLNPVGNGYKWNVLSVDGYNSLDAVFNNEGQKYPDWSSVDFDAIQKQCQMDGTNKSFGNELCGLMKWKFKLQ